MRPDSGRQGKLPAGNDVIMTGVGLEYWGMLQPPSSRWRFRPSLWCWGVFVTSAHVHNGRTGEARVRVRVRVRGYDAHSHAVLTLGSVFLRVSGPSHARET